MKLLLFAIPCFRLGRFHLDEQFCMSSTVYIKKSNVEVFHCELLNYSTYGLLILKAVTISTNVPFTQNLC